MQPYKNVIQSTAGDVRANVQVAVKVEGSGSLATVYSDNGVTPKSNPFNTDSYGEFEFYAPNGRYYLEIAGAPATIPFLLFDAADYGGQLIDVTQFGALGDGATNDTTATQDLINSDPDGIVYFPPGTYIVSGLAVAVTMRFILHPDAIIKLANSANDDVIDISADGVEWIGGQIDGNKTNQTTTLLAGIKITGDNVRVSQATIRAVKGYGVNCLDANRPIVEHCSISNTDYIGIFQKAQTANVEGGEFVRNMVDRTAISAATLSEGGIEISGNPSGGGYTVTGALIDGNDVRLPESPSNSGTICIEVWGGCPRSRITNNRTAGGTMGISTDRSDSSIVEANNVFRASSYGIEVPDSSLVTVSSNTVDCDLLTAQGIALTGSTGSSHTTVSGNTVRHPTTRAYYANKATYPVFSNNTAKLGNTSSSAFSLGTTTRFVINSNNVFGAGTAGGTAVYLSNSDIGVIANNLIANIAAGVQFVSTSGYDFSDMAVVNNTFETVTTKIQNVLSGGSTIGSNVIIANNPGHNLTYLDYSNNVFFRDVDYDPEGVLTAGPGSWVVRRSGGAPGKTMFVKVSGTGNTGWQRLSQHLEKQVTVDVGTVNAQSTNTTTTTVTGLSTSYAFVGVGRDPSMNASLRVEAGVTNAGTGEVTIYVSNPTAGNIAAGSRVYRLYVFNNS